MAPFSLTNKFIAPTFENGVNGWTVSGAGAAGTTLSTSTAYSLHGTQCLKVSIAAGAGAVRLVPPSFPMIVDPYRSFALSLSVASATGGQVSYGWERFKPTTFAFHNETMTASPTITTTMTKYGTKDHLGPHNAAFIAGLLPKITIPFKSTAQEFYFDGFSFFDEADQELYPFEATASSTIPQVAGSWPANDSYSYSWTGAVEASTSVATHRAELFVPAAFNRGDTITVTGTGFPPSSTVDILISDYFTGTPAAAGVPTDASGNLSTTAAVPHHVPGLAYIVGKPAGGAVGSMLRQEVWTNPTDLSAVTNYFPNPNGQTLAVDGVTPKYFGPGEYDGDVVTRVDVGGEYRARFDPEYGMAYLDLGAPSLNALGLDDASHYLIRARLHSDFLPADRWAYIQTSEGNSEVPLVGPSPWVLLGTGPGTFAAPGQFISYSWPDDAVMDLDQVSLVEAAVYLHGWDPGMPAGSSLDGYKIGLRPGRSYQLTGYTYTGTFKIRTGTSPETLTDLLVWENVDPDTTVAAPPNVVTIPAGHTTIQLEASGTDASQVSIYDYVPYFDGDTPDGDGYTYSWAGTPHDSASIRTAAGGTTLDAKVFIGGTAVAVTEMRVVVDGTLIDVTEAGD